MRSSSASDEQAQSQDAGHVPSGRNRTSGGVPLPKDCKACAGAQHLMDAFKRFTHSRDQSSTDITPGILAPAAQEAGPSSQAESSAAAAAATKTLAEPSTSSVDEAAQESYRLENCPPNSGQLGRSTWTFLHSMAAYYPGAHRACLGTLPAYTTLDRRGP